jgi:guanylate kinase
LRDSIADMSHWDEFDYVVVNDDFDRATADLETIVTGGAEAPSLRADRAQLKPLIAELLGQPA